MMISFAGTASARSGAPPSAPASDPHTLGWMQDFPPPADKVIRFTDPDYFAFPKLRWTVCHFRQLMPTVSVDNGSDGVQALEVALDPSIDAVSFQPIGSSGKMRWDAAFDANYSDGVIVLHHGKIVYERYAGCLDPHTLHGAMSVETYRIEDTGALVLMTARAEKITARRR